MGDRVMGLCKDPPPPPTRCIPIRKELIQLVLFVSVKVKDIARLGRSFPWEKPRCCPRCRAGLWWHGFVLAYFSCCAEAVYLRRLRCPHCCCIVRLRPCGFFRQIRSSMLEVLLAITSRRRYGRWRPDLPRGRQRQWWRRMRRLLLAFFGCSHGGCSLDNFRRLIRSNIIPVTAAGKKENRIVR